MQDKFIMLGNWKMHHTMASARSFVSQLSIQDNLKFVEFWLAVPLTVLSGTVQSGLKLLSSLKIGAQNVHWASSGAFTGEVSASMLIDSGCKFTLVGHSERRQHFAESEMSAAARAVAALAAGLKVVFCVGESAVERDQGHTEDVLKRQLTDLLSKIEKSYFKNLLIAYEPVWAVGTDKVPSLDQINQAHEIIKELFVSLDFQAPSVLYGGSVSNKNITKLAGLENVSGVLVGRASLNAHEFYDLAKMVELAKTEQAVSGI